MIVVLLNSYIAILALFVWLRFIPFNFVLEAVTGHRFARPSRRSLHSDGMGRTLGARGSFA
jgi:hypothetical protein